MRSGERAFRGLEAHQLRRFLQRACGAQKWPIGANYSLGWDAESVKEAQKRFIREVRTWDALNALALDFPGLTPVSQRICFRNAVLDTMQTSGETVVESLPADEPGRRRWIIYVGDGTLPIGKATPIDIHARLAPVLGENVRFSAVLLAHDAAGRLLMERLAATTGGRVFRIGRSGVLTELLDWTAAGCPRQAAVSTMSAGEIDDWIDLADESHAADFKRGDWRSETTDASEMIGIVTSSIQAARAGQLDAAIRHVKSAIAAAGSAGDSPERTRMLVQLLLDTNQVPAAVQRAQARVTRDDIAPGGKAVTCSVHGSALAPRQASAPAQDQSLGKLLSRFAGLEATPTFLEDGLHAVVTIDRK